MQSKSYQLLWLFLALPLFLFAQKVDVKQLENMKIRNIGPAGMSGRVTAIDVVQNEPNIIYAGTASGGVWRSKSGGTNWEPIFDDAPVQAIGALKINQRNPAEIWVGTGEGNPRNSQNSGEGLYKSIDGGKTWKLMGLKNSRTIHRIIIQRDDPNTVFVGAHGSAWGPNPERGVFKTTDGGKTWRKILFVNDSTGVADMVVDPSNPNKLIVAMWEYGRKPWTFNSGGKGSGLYVSFDAGETWEKRTDKDGLPKGDLGRLGLAIAPSKPSIVYAIVEAKENALYKSTDGGYKWTKMAVSEPGNNTNVNNRPFYYHEIYVDPKNENRIFSLHSNMTKSEDGGRSFQPWVGWTIHPDHHAFWINPDNPLHMINGNDGGLNISYDGGENWLFAENIPVGQFYHVDVDMSIPYRVLGGMQDNGSWVGPSAVWKAGGIRNSDWQEIYFGDGFDVAVRPDNGRYAYAMSQGGNLGYVDMQTGHTKFIKPVHPKGEDLRFNWNAGFSQNPFHACGIYYGSQFLHKSLDCGNSWEIISPDLTTNDPNKQKQGESGGLTIDATHAENNTTIVAIAPSPVDEKVIWVGTDDGNVQITRDGGKTWVNVAKNLVGSNPGAWIPYIEVSKKRAGEAFVVVSDYRRNDWRPFVYFTSDYGATFRRIADEKQVDGHAFAIVQDPEVDDLLWLGTDYGLWFTIDFGKNWNKWTNGYPSVSTTDLKIHPRDHDLVVGTFGRSFWVLDDIRPIREIARTKGKVLESQFKVFPAPDAYHAEMRSYDGIRFTGNGVFSGTNKMPNAMITLWLNPKKETASAPAAPAAPQGQRGPAGRPGQPGQAPPAAQAESAREEEKEAEAEPEIPAFTGRFGGFGGPGAGRNRIKVQVYNDGGELIRTYHTNVDSGMVRTNWNMRHDGVRIPSRRPSRPNDDLPAGYEVLPGKYKLVFTFGKLKDSTTVVVHDDPRMGDRTQQRIAHQEGYKEFYKLVKSAADGWDRLQEGKRVVRLVNDALVNAPDSVKRDLAKVGKGITDKITELEKRYMVPEGLKGIQRDPNNLTGTMQQVTNYIDASEGAPNASAKVLMEKSRTELTAIISEINKLFAEDISKLKEKVEAANSSLFKDYKPIEMK